MEPDTLQFGNRIIRIPPGGRLIGVFAARDLPLEGEEALAAKRRHIQFHPDGDIVLLMEPDPR